MSRDLERKDDLQKRHHADHAARFVPHVSVQPLAFSVLLVAEVAENFIAAVHLHPSSSNELYLVTQDKGRVKYNGIAGCIVSQCSCRESERNNNAASSSPGLVDSNPHDDVQDLDRQVVYYF